MVGVYFFNGLVYNTSMGKHWTHSEESKKKISIFARQRYKNSSQIMCCNYCGKKYKVPISRVENGRGKYCSRECKGNGAEGIRHSPKTEFKKGQKPWNYEGITYNCFECGTRFHASKSTKRKFCSKKCSDKNKIGSKGYWNGKKRFDFSGIKNPNWQIEPSYTAVHQWLNKKFGRKRECEFCKSATSTRYEWAKIKGKKHERNRDNYMRLCKKCHNDYDKVNAWQQK